MNSLALWWMRLPRTIRLSEKTTRAILRLSSLAVFAVGWELLAVQLDSLLLPSCTETMRSLAHLVVTQELWEAVWISNKAMVLGFLLASTVGVLLGLLMGRWRTAEKYSDPYLNILNATSKSALIPIIIMATGLGLTSRVLVVFISAVVVITVNVRAGMLALEPAWVEMAQSFGASETQLWRKVYLRGALPAVLAGLRLGLARSVSAMVTVELLLIALGIGQLILYYRETFDSASLYAMVVLVVTEAVLLLQVCRWLERRVAVWSGEGVAT
jgi:NitT/TauT family transport system permease protein